MELAERCLATPLYTVSFCQVHLNGHLPFRATIEKKNESDGCMANNTKLDNTALDQPDLRLDFLVRHVCPQSFGIFRFLLSFILSKTMKLHV